MLSNGTVFQPGANGNTAIYDISTGVWSAGTPLPVVGGVQLVTADNPEAVLPNGKVLLPLSPEPYFDSSGDFVYPPGTSIYEYDPSTIRHRPLYCRTASERHNNLEHIPRKRPEWEARMLETPNRHVLLSMENSTQVWDYTPDTATSPPSKPTASMVVRSDNSVAGTYTLTGTELTGLSEGAYTATTPRCRPTTRSCG